ncbi:MAG: acylphosphatase [Armatimonadetes bacterium]|nr:acylphosphatase [Armatimonadota bacterium]
MKGTVQGVGFRMYVQTSASLEELAGEVWNCRDGCVRGIASGDRIDEFVEALWRGPGRVDSVTREPAPEQRFSGFSIVAAR